jgi:hypothetical protein
MATNAGRTGGVAQSTGASSETTVNTTARGGTLPLSTALLKEKPAAGPHMLDSVGDSNTGVQAATAAVPRGLTARSTASGGTGQAMSSTSREELSTFIATSVLPQTSRVYDKNWGSWIEFVKAETGSEDPFMTGWSDEDKAALVSLMMMRRHQGGRRGKGGISLHGSDPALVRKDNVVDDFLGRGDHSDSTDVVPNEAGRVKGQEG